MPGRISGSTTLVKAVSRVQPSVQAASSSSIGMPENSEKVISTANGIASVVCTSARPKAVSSSPVRMNITASGSASSGSGKARVSRISSRNSSLPAKVEARQRIAGRAPDQDRHDHGHPRHQHRVLQRASASRRSLAKNCRLPRSNSGMKRLGKAVDRFGRGQRVDQQEVERHEHPGAEQHHARRCRGSDRQLRVSRAASIGATASVISWLLSGRAGRAG